MVATEAILDFSCIHFHTLNSSHVSLIYYRRQRYIAYRQFVRLVHGFLGKDIRVVLPSCVLVAIRNRFPKDSPQEDYTGFLESNSLGTCTLVKSVDIGLLSNSKVSLTELLVNFSKKIMVGGELFITESHIHILYICMIYLEFRRILAGQIYSHSIPKYVTTTGPVTIRNA